MPVIDMLLHESVVLFFCCEVNHCISNPALCDLSILFVNERNFYYFQILANISNAVMKNLVHFGFDEYI